MAKLRRRKGSPSWGVLVTGAADGTISPTAASSKSDGKVSKHNPSFQMALLGMVVLGILLLLFVLQSYGWFLHDSPSKPLSFRIPDDSALVQRLITTTLSSPWMDLREALCPTGNYPNVQLASVLFSIATNMLVKDNSHMANNVMNDRTMSWFHLRRRTMSLEQRFYHGAFGEGQGDGMVHLPLYDMRTSNNNTLQEDNDNEEPSSLLLYIRIWKCGNDQIRNWLQQTYPTVNENGWWGWMPPTIYQKWNRRRHVCIVTAIRDPIFHFLSGYNEIEARWLGDSSPYGFTNQDKQDLPMGLEYVHHRPGSTERFHQFVWDLVVSQPPIMLQEHWMFEHVFATSRVLSELATLGWNLTAYLPSLDNLSQAWPAFVSRHCPILSTFSYQANNDPPQGRKAASNSMPRMGQHFSSKDPFNTYRAARTVWDQGGATARALCVLHAMDYACWRKLPDGIPDLCQQVYASHDFQRPLIQAIQEHLTNNTHPINEPA